MATTRGTIEAQRKKAKMKKKLDLAKARQREGVKGKRQEYLPEKVDIDAKKSLDRHEKARKNRAKNKTSPTGRAVDDVLRGIFPVNHNSAQSQFVLFFRKVDAAIKVRALFTLGFQAKHVRFVFQDY